MRFRSYVSSRELVGASTLLLLFVGAGYLAAYFEDSLQLLIGIGGSFGMFLYVVVTVAAVVVAPVSTIPLLPIAVVLWGSIQTALLSIVGWTIGALIAYVLAEKYGRPFVRKFVNLRKAQEIAAIAAGRDPFWTIVLLRVIIPVDLLSYALGLFVPLPLVSYTLATAIGVTPFALVFSYAASFSLPYQIMTLVSAGVFAFLVFIRVRKNFYEAGEGKSGSSDKGRA